MHTLTLQEYFERLNSKESWGKPVAALLGAYKAQKELEIGAIGGKDSMSGVPLWTLLFLLPSYPLRLVQPM